MAIGKQLLHVSRHEETILWWFRNTNHRKLNCFVYLFAASSSSLLPERFVCLSVACFCCSDLFSIAFAALAFMEACRCPKSVALWEQLPSRCRVTIRINNMIFLLIKVNWVNMSAQCQVILTCHSWSEHNRLQHRWMPWYLNFLTTSPTEVDVDLMQSNLAWH